VTVARFYDADKNPQEGVIGGAPLADIDQETFDSYPKWLQESIDNSSMYRKTPVRHDKPADKKEGE
jgi:hypothetical protein